MHSYATDSGERKSYPFYLAALAIVSAWLLGVILKKNSIEIPWWIDSPSVLGFFGIYWKLFDRFIWRLKLGALGLSTIPDLNGTWSGEIDSGFNGGMKILAVLQVRQTWTKILVRMQTINSSSTSTMAAVNTPDSKDWGLNYEYLNEPVSNAVNTMQTHRGTVHFRLEENDSALCGDYYGGRGRQNIGSIALRLVSRKATLSLAEAQKLPPLKA